MRDVTLVTLQNWFNHNELRAGSGVSLWGKSEVASGQVGVAARTAVQNKIKGKRRNGVA